MNPALLETWRGVAYPAELDHMGHMNVQYYTAKFDQGTWQLFSHVGISNRYLREQRRGMAAVDQHTRYLAEVMAGDVLVIRSMIVAIGAKSIRFRHHMFDAVSGAEVANTELVAVHMDLVRRESSPFPETIRETVASFIGTAGDEQD